jgi:hypothetical protein
MNSKNLKGLCEAYGGIYTPQELTEEQVWEEVESWVSSLIEEGYDLSDYTWEEMYEAYLEEDSQDEPYIKELQVVTIEFRGVLKQIQFFL